MWPSAGKTVHAKAAPNVWALAGSGCSSARPSRWPPSLHARSVVSWLARRSARDPGGAPGYRVDQGRTACARPIGRCDISPHEPAPAIMARSAASIDARARDPGQSPPRSARSHSIHACCSRHLLRGVVDVRVRHAVRHPSTRCRPLGRVHRRATLRRTSPGTRPGGQGWTISRPDGLLDRPVSRPPRVDTVPTGHHARWA